MVQKINVQYQPILLNDTNDTDLANEGFVVFDLLRTVDIKKLSDYYFEVQKEEPTHFYASTHSPNFDFRKKTSAFIKSIIDPLLPGIFKEYKLLGGAFVVKPAHGKGILQAHQDWNMVDETKHRSYNIWIPLVDVNSQNGAVQVLAQSHSKIKSYRGPNIPSLFKNIEQELWQYLSTIPMKAGQALLYDHALLHGSPPNNTDSVRLGVVCGIIHQDAEMQLCFGNGTNIDTCKVDEGFFLTKNPLDGPNDLVKINSVTQALHPLTIEEFKSLYITTGKTENRNWLKKILHQLWS